MKIMLPNQSLPFESHLQPRLAEPNFLLQHLINQVTEAVVCIDSQARFLYINDAACLLLEKPRKRLLKMNVDDSELDFLPLSWSYYWQLIQQEGFLKFDVLQNTKYQLLEVSINYLEHKNDKFGCISVRISPSHLSSTNFKEISEKQNQISSIRSASISSFYPSCVQLQPIFECIEQNYRRPITLNYIAKNVGYSPAYLTNLVKRRTKRTIINWILERRMLEARFLLTTTSQSVTEIAIAVGFTDAYYFSRRFSQYHKLSPRNWRQKHVKLQVAE